MRIYPLDLTLRTSVSAFLLFTLSACREDPLDAEAVARGLALSKTCSACHQLDGSASMVGPGLKGIIGRTAGTSKGYEYSEGMRASGIVWTPEVLGRFLQDPLAMVPDTKMAVGELTAEEASDLVVYLQSID